MDYDERDSAATMDDDDRCNGTAAGAHSAQGQQQQQSHAQGSAAASQGRPWPFDAQTGSASGPLPAFSPSGKPEPKTEDERETVKIPMQGQRWIGGYKILVSSPGSPYHDTEATMFRINSSQHLMHYFDGTEELCDDAKYTISKPRAPIAEKEKPDGDVDDLEALMKRSFLK